MKYRQLIALSVYLLFLFAIPPALVHAGPSLVFDAQTGKVLHAQDPGQHWYPASLTKLMTAYLVFKEITTGKISLTTKFKTSVLANAQPPSKIGLPVGARISVERGLQALIVRSANDVAVVLAEGVAGSVENFARRMNMTAGKLGMTGSYFANPHGLPDVRQHTTARDLGLLARALIHEFPEYRDYFKMRHVRIGKRRLRNRNSLLKRTKGADGMKTGFICASGYNLVASATRGGRKIVAVLLGEKSGGLRAKKANTLMEGGFNGTKADHGNLLQLANVSSSTEPSNMRPTVCKRTSAIPLTRPSRIKGWGVVFGQFDSASEAMKTVKKNLMALRNVVYSGKGAVVRNHKTGKLAALMGDLEIEEVKKVCSSLRARNEPCITLKPGTLKDPPRAKRRAKKRRGRKTRRKRRTAKRSANFSEKRRRHAPRR